MSVRNAIALLFAVSAIIFLAACGGSGSHTTPVAPPSGGFTTSNLNGTYVFSTTGSDANGLFTAITGDFVANGSGTISSGALDVVSQDSTVGVSTNLAITSSTYTITTDGRGQANLNTASGTITLDFALQSASHGLVTEFDSLGTGSGTIDAQPSAVAQTALTNLTFGLSGVGATFTFGGVGAVTLDPTGLVTAGVEDINNGGTPTTGLTVTPSASAVTVGTGTSPGLATIVTTSGNSTFDVYAIDSTHLKFIETDGVFFTAGDAFVPATTLPSGTLAFTMSGADTSGLPLSVGGFLSAGSTGAITGATEDFNDDGVVSANPVTGIGGSFSALTAGRSVLTLTGFVNGAANALTGTYNFAAYPFTSNGVTGIQLLEIDTGVPSAITSGVAYTQSAITLAASQGYAMDLSALNLNGGGTIFEEDDIAEFTTTSSAFTGIADTNDQTQLSNPQALSGSYTIDGTGRGVATSNLFNFNFYAVNSSTFLVLETDNNQIGTGIFELQGNGASPGSILAPVSMLRPAANPRLALRHK